jgi:hypothetical protein
MEAVSRFLLEILYASASGSDNDMLLGDFLVVAIGCVHRLRCQPLPKMGGNFGLQSNRRNSGLEAAEDVEPVGAGLLQNARLAFENRFCVERNPQGRRIIVNAISEKPGRSDSHNRDWMALNEERGADHVAVTGMRCSPSRIAENSNWRGSRNIVGRLEQAAGIGAKSKGRKIIAGDVFGSLGFGGGIAHANVHQVLTGLERRELLELGGGVLKLPI